MARMAKSKVQENYVRVADNIRQLTVQRNKKVRDVAKYLGMSPATYYARLAHPENFTLEDLTRAACLFNVKLSDLISKKYAMVAVEERIYGTAGY
ncbi:MAG: helix-turn-helix transcriptional regulator [Ruminococcaceae bacterium]|nr:helix-turn-helix transcriptional regulator [Oscillospiraceae bacterium]